ncbi:MAG: hypothetical protein R3D55_21970 [Chloroflexota bacterium]
MRRCRGTAGFIAGNGNLVPSAHNRQPWRFAVLKIAPAGNTGPRHGPTPCADRTVDGDPPDVIERDVARPLPASPARALIVVA